MLSDRSYMRDDNPSQELRPLAWLIGGRGAVLDAATTYLRISAVGLPFVGAGLSRPCHASG